MLGNNTMETASTEVTSIWRQHNVKKSTWRTIDISSILKVESTSKFPRRTDVIISTWIRVSKSMLFRRTFHMEFRHRIDGEATRMCLLGIKLMSLIHNIRHACWRNDLPNSIFHRKEICRLVKSLTSFC